MVAITTRKTKTNNTKDYYIVIMKVIGVNFFEAQCFVSPITVFGM